VEKQNKKKQNKTNKKRTWNEEAEALNWDRKKDRKQDDSDRSKLLTKQKSSREIFLLCGRK